MLDVFVAGAGMTRIGRRTEPLADLMAEAATPRWLPRRRDPDAIVVAAMNPEEFLGDGNFASNIATHLGFAEVPTVRIETATSSGAAALYAGFTQVAAGLLESVLVVGGEKMTHLSTPRVSELIGRSIDPYERSYGATMPALAGLITRALITEHGGRRSGDRPGRGEESRQRRPATRMPISRIRCRSTRSWRAAWWRIRCGFCTVVPSPMARRPSCSRRSARHVRVAGIGQGTDTLAVRHRQTLTRFRATQAAAAAAYAMAGFGPERVDFAEVHDAFAPFELISLEDLGLVPSGKAGRATLDGETARDGRLPINLSGGLKARGHPLAATGWPRSWSASGSSRARRASAR